MYNIKIMSHHLSNFHHLINSTCRIQPNGDLCFVYCMWWNFPLSVNVVSELVFIGLSAVFCCCTRHVTGLTTVSSCCTRHVSTNSKWLNRLIGMNNSWPSWKQVTFYSECCDRLLAFIIHNWDVPLQGGLYHGSGSNFLPCDDRTGLSPTAVHVGFVADTAIGKLFFPGTWLSPVIIIQPMAQNHSFLFHWGYIMVAIVSVVP
jgi:hypothetical protein